MALRGTQYQFSTYFLHEQTFFDKTKGQPLSFETKLDYFQKSKIIMLRNVMSNRIKIWVLRG
jgi:hypothetical protein